MFGNLLENMEQEQSAMKERLAAIEVQGQSSGAEVVVRMTAAKTVTNIAIDKNKVDLEDSEMLEDLLIVAMNRAIEAASEKEAEEAQGLMQKMMPGGLGGLGGLFG